MLVVAGVFVSALAGCGEELDAEKVEDFLRENSQAPALIEAVECPEGVEVDEGDTFECEIRTKGGGIETATLRQTGDARVELAATRQVRLPRGEDLEIIPENVENLIRANAPEPERIVSVDCPANVELEEGAMFRCVVRFSDGSRERVPIVQRDDLGNVEIVERW
jgi:hypothetical protein